MSLRSVRHISIAASARLTRRNGDATSSHYRAEFYSNQDVCNSMRVRGRLSVRARVFVVIVHVELHAAVMAEMLHI